MHCPVFDLLYGGARGGGKSVFLILDWLSHATRCGGKARGLILRRTRKQLSDIIETATPIFMKLGWEMNRSDNTCRGPDGSLLTFAYLDNDADAENYQGWNLCVEKGTNVAMADGSLRKIEDISVGDVVSTLSGPRSVTAVHGSRTTECVKASVYHDGLIVGEQTHPVNHPVLSTYGLISSLNSQKHQTSRQSSRSYSSRDGGEGCDIGERQDCMGWISWREGARSDYRVSSDGRATAVRPRGLFVPVVLHAPIVRKALERRGDHASSTEFRSQGISHESSLDLSQETQWEQSGLQRLSAHDQSQMDLFSPSWTSDGACDLVGKRTRLGSRYDCQSDHGFGGEPVPVGAGTATCELPSPACVASPLQTSLWGESGTIPTHSPLDPLLWEHPYTGEEMRLAEEVVSGVALLTPCGDREVFDITVDGVNHYITETGLVNKNSWLGIDEGGNFPKSTPIDKLYATLRVPGVEHRFRITANPGGPGHQWLRERYIKPALPFKAHKAESGIERIYIPAKLADNPYTNTPEYVQQLKSSGPDWLVKAWVDGDWDVIPGGGIIDPDKIKNAMPPENMIRRLIGGDLAFTEDTRNDESAFLELGKWSPGDEAPVQYHITHVDHGHYTIADSVRKVFDLHAARRVRSFRIEGGPSGRALDPFVRERMRAEGVLLDFQLVSHMRDKVSKSIPFASAVGMGLVYADKSAEWWPAFRDECLIFDGDDGKSDNMVDAASVAFSEIDMLFNNEPLPAVAPAPHPRSMAVRDAYIKRQAEARKAAGPRLMWR